MATSVMMLSYFLQQRLAPFIRMDGADIAAELQKMDAKAPAATSSRALNRRVSEALPRVVMSSRRLSATSRWCSALKKRVTTMAYVSVDYNVMESTFLITSVRWLAE